MRSTWRLEYSCAVPAEVIHLPALRNRFPRSPGLLRCSYPSRRRAGLRACDDVCWCVSMFGRDPMMDACPQDLLCQVVRSRKRLVAMTANVWSLLCMGPDVSSRREMSAAAEITTRKNSEATRTV